MAHMMIEGVDRMAAVDGISIWHQRETVQKEILKLFPAIVAGEDRYVDFAAQVFPQGSDNDIAGTMPIATVEQNDKGEWIVHELLESHVSTVAPSKRSLGVVTKGYTCVPFRVLLTDWVYALIKAGGEIETLGTFDAGRNMFASILVADPWKVPGDHSLTKLFFNVLANNSGERSILGSFADFREICRNTAMAYARKHEAMAGNAKERARNAWVSMRHTANVKERIADAVEYITDGRSRAESEKELLARLAAKVISKQEVDKFISDYISIPDDASKRTKSLRGNARDTFVEALADVDDLGNHAMGSNGISAYGLLQAVTRNEDWLSSVRAGDTPVGTRRAFRAFLGEREVEKATARDRIIELAGVQCS